MSVKSMTGFGRASEIVDGKEISIEIKSVNHRYFDFNAKILKDYQFLEDKLKSRVNSAVSRGKIELYLYVDTGADTGYDIEVNQQLANGYAEAFSKLSETLSVHNDISASFLARVPDVIVMKKKELDEQWLEDSVMRVLDNALKSYDIMRNAEGAKLLTDVTGNLDLIINTVDKIEQLSPQSIEQYKTRLRTKMLDALEGREYDEQRLITEVALFADKIDVGEETVRLRSHISQFRGLMNDGQQAIGKKLDFIVQEMNREINTIGSKCSLLEITQLVVETKSVIEKIREQIQNIE